MSACGFYRCCSPSLLLFFFQAEDGIRDVAVTGVQTCALPIWAVVSRDGAAVGCPRDGDGAGRGDVPEGWDLGRRSARRSRARPAGNIPFAHRPIDRKSVV